LRKAVISHFIETVGEERRRGDMKTKKVAVLDDFVAFSFSSGTLELDLARKMVVRWLAGWLVDLHNWFSSLFPCSLRC
jgi:hypothetical protein